MIRYDSTEQTPRPNFTLQHLLVMAGFYVFFAGAYALTISLTWKFTWPLAYRTAIDYLLKALYTLPVWYVVIYKMDKASIQAKLLAHLVLCPIYITTWFYSYYFLLDVWNIKGLSGSGRWWDVYIPLLVYTAQFALLHNYWYNQKLRFQTEQTFDLKEMFLKSEVSALKAQINPHFLFNTLNSISASVPLELENTRNMVAKLADIFRYVLMASQKEVVLLKEEIAFIKNYLDLEKERFGERLQVHYAIDEAALAIAIPPMLLQPLVENSVKHGISPSIEGGTIRLVVEVIETHLQIRIIDDGVANEATFPKNAFTKGIGLKNTALRLEKLYQTQLTVDFNVPQGLIVQFIIPMANQVAYETSNHY
ncbi:hypothetical protein BKI52_29335 [marine bacterium AO1-C]|nr:hypothetical protein BKI52_29335 [marine bacterium AO1-C]